MIRSMVRDRKVNKTICRHLEKRLFSTIEADVQSCAVSDQPLRSSSSLAARRLEMRQMECPGVSENFKDYSRSSIFPTVGLFM